MLPAITSPRGGGGGTEWAKAVKSRDDKLGNAAGKRAAMSDLSISTSNGLLPGTLCLRKKGYIITLVWKLDRHLKVRVKQTESTEREKSRIASTFHFTICLLSFQRPSVTSLCFPTDPSEGQDLCLLIPSETHISSTTKIVHIFCSLGDWGPDNGSYAVGRSGR